MPGFLQILLQLERIALDAKVDIANGKAGDKVADSSAGEIEVQSRIPGYFLNQIHTALLIRCEPGFHAIDVVCHLNV